MKEDIQDALNEMRLIVLIECEDGKFRQVALNAAQFKKVSDACVAHKPDEQPDDLRANKEVVHMHLNDEWSIDADALLGLGSINDNEADCA